MKRKAFATRWSTLLMILLAVGLLGWGVPGLALAQSAQSPPGFTDSSYPSDYYRPPATGNGIHTEADGKIPLVPMQAPVADHAASGFRMGEGATSTPTASAPAQNAPDRPMVPVAGD